MFLCWTDLSRSLVSFVLLIYIPSAFYTIPELLPGSWRVLANENAVSLKQTGIVMPVGSWEFSQVKVLSAASLGQACLAILTSTVWSLLVFLEMLAPQMEKPGGEMSVSSPAAEFRFTGAQAGKGRAKTPDVISTHRRWAADCTAIKWICIASASSTLTYFKRC